MLISLNISVVTKIYAPARSGNAMAQLNEAGAWLDAEQRVIPEAEARDRAPGGAKLYSIVRLIAKALLRAILAKLEPPASRPEPLPPLKAGMGPSHGQGRGRHKR